MSSPDTPRGTYKGERVGKPLTDEAEHFIRCPACGGWIDCRDLGQVFEHEGPLPHSLQDQPQWQSYARLGTRAWYLRAVFLELP